jgi:hypothetical protein
VALQKARSLGKGVFTEMGPDSEDGLCEFLKDKCEAWISSLANYKNLADTGIYPGQREIGDGLSTLNSLLVADESAEFISTFLESTVELHDLSDAFHDIDNFYRHQKPTWESLRNGCARFDLNRLELERHEQARTALHRMTQILTATSPYSLLHEAEGLVSTVDKINNALVTERRDNALARITDLQSRVVQAVERANGDDSLRRVCLLPLEVLRHSVESQESVAHIAEAVQESELALDVALEKTDAFMDSAGRGDESNTITRTAKQSKTINPASLMESRYLETPADIDDFLAALRRELEDALGKGERVRIR